MERQDLSSPRIDRRAVRTRARLSEALLRLLVTRPYEAVTVEEICAEAAVGRSTFYAHFADKDDLKRRGLDLLQGELTLARAATSGDRAFGFCEAFFAHAAAHQGHIRALGDGRGTAVSRDRLRAILSDQISRDLLARRPEIARSPDFRPRVAAAVAALIGLFDWWLAEGGVRPPGEMAALFRQLASHGFHA
jgi:AcrR family transcriptional regulator